jgi:hypothetical protein
VLQPIEEGQTGAGRVREEGEKRANDVLPVLEEQEEEDQITVRRQVHPSQSAVIPNVRTAFGV